MEAALVPVLGRMLWTEGCAALKGKTVANAESADPATLQLYVLQALMVLLPPHKVRR